MFDISEANILEQGEAGEISGDKDEQYISISRNQTEPNMIVDGVDSIEIFRESDNRFRVEYWGYMSGRLWITHDGVSELKQCFFDDREEIPGWTLSTELSEIPDWFPTPRHVPSSVTCDECRSDVSVTAVVTPLSEETNGRYCPDCWSSVREDL